MLQLRYIVTLLNCLILLLNADITAAQSHTFFFYFYFFRLYLKFSSPTILYEILMLLFDIIND